MTFGKSIAHLRFEGFWVNLELMRGGGEGGTWNDISC